MNKFSVFVFLFFSVCFFSQKLEIREIKAIDKKYDSILIAYQKKAKDSLANFSKKERTRIMAQYENGINGERRKQQLQLLQKIKLLESEQQKFFIKEEGEKCRGNRESFQMPKLDTKSSYKPTESKDVKTGFGNDGELKSIVTFVVNSKGEIGNVRAEGQNQDFNRELELILYKLENWTPLCVNGITTTNRFRLPVTLNLK